MKNYINNEKIKEILEDNNGKEILVIGDAYLLNKNRNGYLIFNGNKRIFFYGGKSSDEIEYTNCYNIEIHKCYQNLFYYIDVTFNKYEIDRGKLKYINMKDGFKFLDEDKADMVVKYFNEPIYKFLDKDVSKRIKNIEKSKLRKDKQEELNILYIKEKKEKEIRESIEKEQFINKWVETLSIEIKNNECLNNIFVGFIKKYCSQEIVYSINEAKIVTQSSQWNKFKTILIGYISTEINDLLLDEIILQILRLTSINYFASVWEDKYGKQFKDLEKMNLYECTYKYTKIDYLQHEEIHNINNFIMYLIYNKKMNFKHIHDYEVCKDIMNNMLNYIKQELVLDNFKNMLIDAATSKQHLFSIEYVDMLSGLEFEDFICNLFNKMGYKSFITKATGDQGIDVIAEKNNIRLGIQTKCYSNYISNTAIQEVVAGLNFYDCSAGMVVTNNYFTKSAMELAKANEIMLWDREMLIEKINKFL